MLHPFFLGAQYSEKLYSRDLNAPPIKLYDDEKIWIFSPCRTGSTLVYNILKYLCEDKEANAFSSHEKRVVKSHENFGINEQRGYVFITLRNPFDAAQSFCNLRGVRKRWEAITTVTLLNQQFCKLHHFYENKNKSCVKKIFIYEQFETNLPFLLDEIEKVFEQKISSFDRSQIISLFNRQAMKEISDNLGPIHNTDPLTALVGGHVQKPRNKYVKMKAFHRAVIPHLKAAFKLWGFDVPKYDE